MGWGSITIGICLLCAGFYESLSGNYSITSTGNRGGWIKGLFSILFAANGPYMHALIWFALAGAFIWAGIFSLETPLRAVKLEKFSGQKPRVRSKK
jgi:hypothetical protein